MLKSKGIKLLKWLFVLSLIVVILLTLYDRFFSGPQWELEAVNATKSWTDSSGKNIIIAILDTGVNNDYNFSLIRGYNTQDHSSNTKDENGHGTLVAGLAAGNGPRYYGSAPLALVMPIKALDQNGVSESSRVAEGIIWAADHGANIINLSVGSPRYSKIVDYAVQYAVKNNVIVVAAAGDGGYRRLFYPAAFENVISVSSLDRNNQKLSFVNYDDNVDILAPGDSIERTIHNQKQVIEGTSASVPIVSGAIAQLLERNPALDIKQIKALLHKSLGKDKRLDIPALIRSAGSNSGYNRPAKQCKADAIDLINPQQDLVSLTNLHLLPDHNIKQNSQFVTISLITDYLRKITFNDALRITGDDKKRLTKKDLWRMIIDNTKLSENLSKKTEAEYKHIALGNQFVGFSGSQESGENLPATSSDLFHALIKVLDYE